MYRGKASAHDLSLSYNSLYLFSPSPPFLPAKTRESFFFQEEFHLLARRTILYIPFTLYIPPREGPPLIFEDTMSCFRFESRMSRRVRSERYDKSCGSDSLIFASRFFCVTLRVWSGAD